MKKGFTLSEVLITLTIVGIVASITIPSLKMSMDKAEYVTGVKKAYTILQQAYTRAKTDNGGVIDTLFSASMSHADSLNAFLNNMNVSQKCGTADGCIYNSDVRQLNIDAGPNFYSDTSLAKAILSDSMIILLISYQSDCATDAGYVGVLKDSMCGSVFVDINGFRPPNQMGRDFFKFWITKSGVYPWGSATYDDKTCITGVGDGCAARVIQEGAMNY